MESLIATVAAVATVATVSTITYATRATVNRLRLWSARRSYRAIVADMHANSATRHTVWHDGNGVHL